MGKTQIKAYPGGGPSLVHPRTATYQDGHLCIGHAEQHQAQSGSHELWQGPTQCLAKNRPLAYKPQLLGSLWRGGRQSAFTRPWESDPVMYQAAPLALTLTKSRKSSEAASPRATEPS